MAFLVPLSDLMRERDELRTDHLDHPMGHPLYVIGGANVGKVHDVLVDPSGGHVRYLVVRSGSMLHHKDLLVPVGLARIEDDAVYLEALTREQFLDLRPYTPGEALEGPGDARGPTAPSSSYTNPNFPSPTTAPTPLPATASEDLFRTPERLRLLEERLVVDKRRVPIGSVEVGKHVETRSEHVSVPLTREVVEIRRHPVEDERRADGVGIGQGSATLRVDVEAERAAVHKRAFMTEEVEVGKRAVVETHTVTETVGREVLDVKHIEASDDRTPLGIRAQNFDSPTENPDGTAVLFTSERRASEWPRALVLAVPILAAGGALFLLNRRRQSANIANGDTAMTNTDHGTPIVATTERPVDAHLEVHEMHDAREVARDAARDLVSDAREASTAITEQRSRDVSDVIGQELRRELPPLVAAVTTEMKRLLSTHERDVTSRLERQEARLVELDERLSHVKVHLSARPRGGSFPVGLALLAVGSYFLWRQPQLRERLQSLVARRSQDAAKSEKQEATEITNERPAFLTPSPMDDLRNEFIEAGNTVRKNVSNAHGARGVFDDLGDDSVADGTPGETALRRTNDDVRREPRDKR
ncbi:PRC and DUF2382 domain-containing protein [Deinococcus yavapaiensis]|uniref:Uncharacterized protein (TIGR02271 family) n=1 Tax=Deinococcus yavapaiensis KR-236 TaxID=694435 RepID=A0A318S3A5_9DEIO|nr:PRC and DUF2382 domain-containing protein [Deinococcus yavapaiensis]PYE52872.1 uncharacterized protein (TIGR02271 family) [Deinococcus yavapaiensis KR-236]